MNKTATDDLPNVWKGKENEKKIFLSHMAIHKEYTAELQISLSYLGFFTFAAPSHIKSGSKWPDEIERALRTCDALIVILHDGVVKSEWIDQEVGYALGRNVPVYPINMGQLPYGLLTPMEAPNGDEKSPDQIAKEFSEFYNTQRPPATSQSVPAKNDEPSTLDNDIDYLINLWRKETKDLGDDVPLNENFIVYGFEFIDISPELDSDVEEIKKTISTIQPPDPEFFDGSGSGDANPSFYQIDGIDGLQSSRINLSRENTHLATLWHLSKKLSGVEIVAYQEDSIHLAYTFDSWRRGNNFWVDYRIRKLEQFLYFVNTFAETFEFDGKIRIKILYYGLKGRQLCTIKHNSPHHYDKLTARQDYAIFDSNFKKTDLEKPIRSSAIISITKEAHKFFSEYKMTSDHIKKILEDSI